MVRMWMKSLFVALLGVVGLGLCNQTYGAVITSAGGGFSAGINTGTLAVAGGNLYDAVAAVGFRRAAGAFDPIAPGAPRESYGVSAGATGGYVDPQVSIPPVLNMVPVGLPVVGPNTLSITTRLQVGVTMFLTVVQDYSFVAGNENFLKISTTITNVSGSAQAVQWRRLVDFDVDPGFLGDTVTFPAQVAPINGASWNRFISGVSSNPTVPLLDVVPPGGGTFPPVGTDDVGVALNLDLGMLANGASTSFDYYYALNQVGQTTAQLLAQGLSLGLGYGVTQIAPGVSGNTAAVFLPAGTPNGAIPEPSSVALFGLGLVGVVGFAYRRLRKRVA